MCTYKVLFVKQGAHGYVGTAASFMFPRVLSQLGYDVKVLSFCDENAVIEKDPNLIEVRSINLFAKVRKICEIANQFQPEIIHVFNNVEGNSLLPLICSVAIRSKPKWLIDVRSPPLRANKVPWWLRNIKLIRDFLRQTGYSAISAPVKQSAVDVYHFVVKPLYELPFGVDLDRISKKNWNFRVNGIVPVKRFIYVGSIAKLRKLETLLEGICVAKDRLGDSDVFEVDFYGDGDDIDNLNKSIIKLNIESIVTVKGFVNQSDLFSLLLEYDAGIGYVPYEQYMYSPALKIVEYMAANLAVIASDTEGVKIHLTNQVNGILFENTAESIASTIVNVVKNGYPKQLLHAADEVVKSCSWLNVVENKLLPIYKSLQR